MGTLEQGALEDSQLGAVEGGVVDTLERGALHEDTVSIASSDVQERGAHTVSIASSNRLDMLCILY